MAIHDTNALIGARLKQRRKVLGLSQSDIGNQLGVTFQQLQKYENGQNRISAASLFEFCRANKLDIQSFYDDVVKAPRHLEDMDEKHQGQETTTDNTPELHSLFKHYTQITDPTMRSLIMELVLKLSATSKKDA